MCQGRIRFWKPRQRGAYKVVATCARIAHDGGMLIFTILQGLSSGLRMHESPLYRYPYRSAEEAFRGDAKKVYQDVEASLERGHE